LNISLIFKEFSCRLLNITYNHTAKIQDWMTRNYLSYLRVYVPKGSSLVNSSDPENIRSGEELGKDYFGSIVRVPLGQTSNFEISYTLPENFSNKDYDLLIQKQSGLASLKGKVTIIGRDGQKTEKDIESGKDWTMN